MKQTCLQCNLGFDDAEYNTVCPHGQLPPAGPVIMQGTNSGKTEAILSGPNTLPIKDWCTYIHKWAHKKGFYTGGRDCTWFENHAPDRYPCLHRSGGVAAQIMLVVTELAEAVEADRKKDADNFKEEIADAVIRLFDLCGAHNIDLEKEIARKMVTNEGRPFQHGKAY